jgi:hypothetical protein
MHPLTSIKAKQIVALENGHAILSIPSLFSSHKASVIEFVYLPNFESEMVLQSTEGTPLLIPLYHPQVRGSSAIQDRIPYGSRSMCFSVLPCDMSTPEREVMLTCPMETLLLTLLSFDVVQGKKAIQDRMARG